MIINFIVVVPQGHVRIAIYIMEIAIYISLSFRFYKLIAENTHPVNMMVDGNRMRALVRTFIPSCLLLTSLFTASLVVRERPTPGLSHISYYISNLNILIRITDIENATWEKEILEH